MNEIQYAIFYGDESVEETDFEGLANVKKLGVQVIAQYGPGLWHICTKGDFYCHDPEMNFYAVDCAGRIQYEMRPGWTLTLWGETIPSDRYQRILKAAHDYAHRKRLECQENQG